MPEGSQKRKATRVRSLRQRWIVNSVVPIFVLLALIVGGVSLGISNYYYKGMLDGLERQARAQSGAFVDYFMDQGFANYLQRANQAISDYADKERVEMQFLSSIGRIQASSTSNLTVGTRPGTEDISRAVETNRISYFRGADPKTGEQILAVSHPLTVNGKVVDLAMPVNQDASVKLNKWEDPEGKATFWHTSSHLLAEALESDLHPRPYLQVILISGLLYFLFGHRWRKHGMLF